MMASTPIPHRWKYDVFVSFRGEDIRKSFMDHLFKDFRQKGIFAFRDDKELCRGEEISPELYKAIEESRFLLVIFSKNYASSSWCLRELVKILECKQLREYKHEVRTIFYDVKPNIVRKQTESYAEAFARHESSNRTEVTKWREALFKAADLSGWDLQDMTNGYESKFIDNITKEILERLHHGPLHVGENLVGVYSQVDELNLLRSVGSDKVHIIGICGIGGIGKTTFAKALYNKLYIYFEECSFCEDVQGTAKRHGLAQVQMQLVDDIMKTRAVRISNVSQGIMVMKQTVASKRILLVLDDVDDSEQIDALAGSRCWFFPGSVIIFTCKDKQLLSSYRVDGIHDIGYLDDHKALELFSLHAFGAKHPTEDFRELAYRVVRYVQGHPLALKVLGRFLSNKAMSEWKSELDRLQVYPNADIQNVLRLSFDGLTFDQKRIFLDIAYAFIGENKDFTASVLDGCKQFPQTNMRVLVDKSLITISLSHKLQMHDLIQIMAKEIVREEANMSGKLSRLWIQSKALKEIEVKESTEVLVLLLEKSSQGVHIDGKAFTRMKNLRILKVYDPELEKFGHPCPSLMLPKEFKVNYTGKLEFLSNKLSLLCWHGYPFKFLPSDFYPENIVVIDLSYSRIKNLWTKAKCFRRLKVMKLRYCRNLTSTPDFTEITNLEKLYLDGCVNLVNVHPSIRMLKRLVVLSMRNCSCVKSFQCIFEMESLQVLDLSGCSKVHKFPEFMCREQTLISLPSCFSSRIQHPQSLVSPSLARLCSLRELNISNCNILLLPDGIGGLSCLTILSLWGNNFTSLPNSLSQLPRLRSLFLDDCKNLEALPKIPPSLSELSASDCTSLHKPLTNDSYRSLKTLRLLSLGGCPKLLKYMIPNESEEVCISQPQDLATSITSHGSRNIAYSLASHFLNKHVRNDEVYMVFYGSRGIPEWFKNQSKGNDDVKVELPQSYKSIRGFATCVVFTTEKLCSVLKWDFVVKNGNGASVGFGTHIGCTERNYETIARLFYRREFIWEAKEVIWEQEEKDFVTFSVISYNEGVNVKEWGVRLVYEEDEEEEAIHLIRAIPEFTTPTIHGCKILMSTTNRPTFDERRSLKLEW